MERLLARGILWDGPLARQMRAQFNTPHEYCC